MGTLGEPGPEVAALLGDAVLDIAFVGLVAGEGDAHPRQEPGLAVRLPVELVEEVAAEVTVAEDQPVSTGVASAAAGRRALLHEGAEGRHTGPGGDHDHGGIGVGRQPKGRVLGEIDLELGVLGQTPGQEARGGTLARLAADLEAQSGDRQVDLVRGLGLAGGDGIEPGTQRQEEPRECGRIGPARVLGHQVDELAGAGIGAQALRVGTQVGERRDAGELRPGRDHPRVQLGEFQTRGQGLAQVRRGTVQG